MRLISISGGATKIIALIAAFYKLSIKKIKPDVMCGISAGAIISICHVTGNTQRAMNLILKMNLKTIFGSYWNRPVNKKGKQSLPAILRVVQGKNYLGRMRGLEKNLKELITPENWLHYLRDPKGIPAYVMAVNANTKQKKIWNLKELDYQTAIKAVLASSSIAAMVPPVEIDGELYYDGGHRDHSIGHEIIERYDFTEVISIYSRPDYLGGEQLEPNHGWNKNLLATIDKFIISCFNYEVTINDECKEREKCKKKGAKYIPIFIDSFSKSLYDISPSSLRRGYLAGLAAVERYYL